MPLFDYTCSNCQATETRIAGVDDHTVICDQCGQVMVRKADLDAILASYKTPEPVEKAGS